MDKTKVNLERLRAYDAEWEEDKHPRAENGQFTSGSGSSAGGGAESGSKYGYSRSEQHVASKMEEWGNEQGNIAALEAADAFRDAREDENDMREVLKTVRQHLVENENEIRGYDDNPKNFDKVMEELDDMESMLDDQDDYEFKHGEIKSPIRQAAEVIQGGDGRLKGYKGLSFTQETSEADSGTPAGEVHNFIVGNLKGKEPTKENVTAACKQVVNMLNDDIKYLSERAATARRYGNEPAAKEWEANIEKQQQRIQAAYEVTMGFSK